MLSRQLWVSFSEASSCLSESDDAHLEDLFTDVKGTQCRHAVPPTHAKMACAFEEVQTAQSGPSLLSVQGRMRVSSSDCQRTDRSTTCPQQSRCRQELWRKLWIMTRLLSGKLVHRDGLHEMSIYECSLHASRFRSSVSIAHISST